jgi:2-polyprenyl-3-methyl-5-hydroxy-6-metoxy-1,4-benzoquinol methylase
MENISNYQKNFEERLCALKYYHALEETKNSKKILDLGCCTGGLFESFIKRGQEIYGVEIDREAVKIGKEKGYFIIEGDLEDEKTFKEIENIAPFDAVLALDVLEHLKDPWKFLEKLKNIFEKEGFIFATIPNIANWKIRLKILLGKFNYEDEGILDKGHLRFFNFKGIVELFEKSNYKIEKIFPTSSFLPFFPKKWEWKAIQISRIAPNLFTDVFGVKAYPLK